MKPRAFVLLAVCIIVSTCTAKHITLTIPFVENIKIDGMSEDWSIKPLIGSLTEHWKHLVDDTKLYMAANGISMYPHRLVSLCLSSNR